MNRPNFLSRFPILLLIAVFGISAVIAQTETRQQAEPNYEIMLHVILGSNDAQQKSELSQNFSLVARQLKSNFAFSNYRLVNTYLGRLGNNGNIEYKSVADIFGQEQQIDSPSFLDWRIGGLRSMSDSGGRSVMQLQSFSFGAKIPLRMGNFKAPDGKYQNIVNYEPVGLKLDRVSLAENSPTLIGTLSLPKTSGTAFLVLTVRRVEN